MSRHISITLTRYTESRGEPSTLRLVFMTITFLKFIYRLLGIYEAISLDAYRGNAICTDALNPKFTAYLKFPCNLQQN